MLDRGVRADREVRTIPFLERRHNEVPRVFLFPATSLTHRQCGWDRAISLATIVPWCRRWVRPSLMLVFDRGIRVCIFSSRFSPYRQHPLISRSSLSFRFFFLSRVILKPLRFDWTFSVFQCQNERGMRECFRSNDFSVYTQCLFRNWPRDYLVYEIISLFLLNVGYDSVNHEWKKLKFKSLYSVLYYLNIRIIRYRVVPLLSSNSVIISYHVTFQSSVILLEFSHYSVSYYSVSQ